MSTHPDLTHRQLERTFALLYATHRVTVRRFVESIWDGNEHEVDDIVEDVFVVAWRKWDRAQGLELRWLLRTAENKIRDRRRHQRVVDGALAAVVVMAKVRSDTLAELDRIALQSALGRFGRKERRLIELFYWGRCTSSEIAAELNMSVAAVWTMLSRGRTKLRSALGADDASEAPRRRSHHDTPSDVVGRVVSVRIDGVISGHMSAVT